MIFKFLFQHTYFLHEVSIKSLRFTLFHSHSLSLCSPHRNAQEVKTRMSRGIVIAKLQVNNSSKIRVTIIIITITMIIINDDSNNNDNNINKNSSERLQSIKYCFFFFFHFFFFH